VFADKSVVAHIGGCGELRLIDRTELHHKIAGGARQQLGTDGTPSERHKSGIRQNNGQQNDASDQRLGKNLQIIHDGRRYVVRIDGHVLYYTIMDLNKYGIPLS